MAVGDVTSLSFTSQTSGVNSTPALNFSVGMSSSFSSTQSIQLLYWRLGGHQEWITLTRSSSDAPFAIVSPLSFYAASGTYDIRSIIATDNTGTEVYITEQQINESGFSTTTNLINPNSDDQAPLLQSILVGTPTISADGNIHIHFDIKATDSVSGLKPDFVLELLSPSGVSLQQWCKFDSQGSAAVDFLLDKFSASGNYKINTIRVEDMAGNAMSADYNNSWLTTNNIQPVYINNPLSDSTAPTLGSFSISAEFDPLTDRPKIVVNFSFDDAVSGIKSAFLRMLSPIGSSVFLDKWIFYSYSLNGETHVTARSEIPLTTDYKPGLYTVDTLKISDFASNSVTYGSVELGNSGVMSSINVYFPEHPVKGGNGEVVGSSNSDYVFGSDIQDDKLIGNGGNDSISGGGGADTLIGGTGNDNLFGGAGNDSLSSGTGNDKLDGGGGRDVATLDGTLADYDVSTINNNVSTPISFFTLTGLQPGEIIQLVSRRDGHMVQLVNVENINFSGDGSNISVTQDQITNSPNIGTDGNDILTGGMADDDLSGGLGDDVINGGSGNDIINGGDGTDWVYYDTATFAVSINLNLKKPQQTIGAGKDTLISIENILGSDFDDDLLGNSLDNVINGAMGNDSLNGGVGQDTLIGGGGDDIFRVDSLGDVITEEVNAGIDIVKSNVSYALATNLEKLFLVGTDTINGTGNTLNNVLVGNGAENHLSGDAGDDTLDGGKGNDVLTGDAGNDILNGGEGIDSLIGGDGYDIYYVDKGKVLNINDTIKSLGDVITEVVDGGVDTVYSSAPNYTISDNVENLILTKAGKGTGNAQDNNLTGSNKANVIDGAGGNDIIDGGSGKDILIGGDGADIFVFDTAIKGNVDILKDFATGVDKIRLNATIFSMLVVGDADLSDNFVSNEKVKALDANDYLLFNTKSGSLYYDADGSGSVNAVQFAILKTIQDVSATDFVIG